MTGDSDEAGFGALTAKIARDRSFGTASYKDAMLRRRIAVRMRIRGSSDFGSYSRLLDTDPEEYDRLIDALTVNVTKLFRNHEVWNAVAANVLPALWSTGAPRLRCWVAGCASGEEAYTLAALWHRFVSARGEDAQLSRVSIVGTDIDRRSLEAASAGAYASAAFGETPDDVRARFFRRDEKAGLESAAAELRALVRFERHDLLLEPPPRGPMQLITCRNVTIYFDRESQAALMRRFHETLAPDGFLVLGKVETLLGPMRTLFDVVDQKQRIFRRR